MGTVAMGGMNLEACDGALDYVVGATVGVSFKYYPKQTTIGIIATGALIQLAIRYNVHNKICEKAEIVSQGVLDCAESLINRLNEC